LGELDASRSEVEAAIRRDPQDWRLWLIRARIETKLGAIRAATASLRHAAELNPRSQLVRRVTDG
jgi:Tfp pilus assembly protein PilF